MSQPIVQIDAFTDQPFRGNPAAVCLMDQPADPDWMQLVAREMNLSETAFLYPTDGRYHLRWFTPLAEMDLCGHATLASAHHLWEEKIEADEAIIRFDTMSGELTARRVDGLIELDFPANTPVECATPAGLETALGAPVQSCYQTENRYMAVLESEEEVRKLEPNFLALSPLVDGRLIVTALSPENDFDFISRYFAPALGVNEDPVTGSAHTVLGPYWAGQLGRSELIGYQASVRGGYVRVRVVGDRVFLGGKAVTVMRGSLL